MINLKQFEGWEDSRVKEIHLRTKSPELLAEVKRLREELKIIDQVLDDRTHVHIDRILQSRDIIKDALK